LKTWIHGYTRSVTIGRTFTRAFSAILQTVCMLAMLPNVGSGRQPQHSTIGAVNREDYVAGQPFNVGNEWVLLADDYFVEDKIGISRVMGHVTKLPNNPVVLPDLPWEDYISGPSVIFDEETGLYHMWYQGWNSTAWFARYFHSSTTQIPEEYRKRWYSYWVGYASSRDGVHWEKPLLDLHPYLDFKKTNIVLGDETNPEAPFVWLNQDHSNPARRFLMTYAARLPDEREGQSLMLAYSADGIHWNVDNQVSPLLTQIPDGSFQVLSDAARDRWLLFRRPDYKSAALVEQGPYAAVRPNGRYAVSLNRRLGPGWSYPRIVLVPDEEVEPRDIDHMKVFRYGTHYLGLLGMMDDRVMGLQEVNLAVSHDGMQWTRFPYLPPLIPRGPAGSFDAGQVQPPYALTRGEFTYLYYCGDIVGQRVQQGYYSSIAVARMRRGRWIGVKSDVQGGYLLTREMVVTGDHLEINFQGIEAPYMQPIEGRPSGFVRVELLRRNDATGKLDPIPGFQLKDSDALSGDSLASIATWNGKADLGSLRGTAVYVRFHILCSELWGFRFASNK